MAGRRRRLTGTSREPSGEQRCRRRRWTNAAGGFNQSGRLARILREESVTRGTEPCAKWPHGVLPEERRCRHIVAQGKTSTAAGCTGLGLVVAILTHYPG